MWAAMFLGSCRLFAFGLAWLSRFVVGDLLKQVLAALLLPGLWKLRAR